MATRGFMMYGPQASSVELNVKDYGAKGDYTSAGYLTATDNRSAFLACLAAVEAAGGGTMIIPPGDYLTLEKIEAQITKPLKIKGAGARVIRDYRRCQAGGGGVYGPLLNGCSYEPILSLYNSWTISPTGGAGPKFIDYNNAAGAIAEGSYHVHVLSTSNLEIGDLILFQTTEVWDGTTVKMHMSYVTKIVSASEFEIADPFPFTFNDPTPGGVPTYTISLYGVESSPKLVIDNLVLEWTGTSGVPANPYTTYVTVGDSAEGLYLEYLVRPELRNVTILNPWGAAVYVSKCYGGLISNCNLRTFDCNIEIGYGVQTSCWWAGVIDSCQIQATRHDVALSGGPTWGMKITNCVLGSMQRDSGNAMDVHMAHEFTVSNSTLYGGAKFSATHTTFRGCRVQNQIPSASMYPPSGAETSYWLFNDRGNLTAMESFLAENCTLDLYNQAGGACGIFGPSPNTVSNGRHIFRNCDITFHTGAPLFIYGQMKPTTSVGQWIVDGCTIRGDSGVIGTMFAGVTVTAQVAKANTGTFIFTNNKCGNFIVDMPPIYVPAAPHDDDFYPIFNSIIISNNLPLEADPGAGHGFNVESRGTSARYAMQYTVNNNVFSEAPVLAIIANTADLNTAGWSNGWVRAFNNIVLHSSGDYGYVCDACIDLTLGNNITMVGSTAGFYINNSVVKLSGINMNLSDPMNPVKRYAGAPVSTTLPDVTGSKGANAALTSLIAALKNWGIISDSTT